MEIKQKMVCLSKTVVWELYYISFHDRLIKVINFDTFPELLKLIAQRVISLVEIDDMVKVNFKLATNNQYL